MYFIVVVINLILIKLLVVSRRITNKIFDGTYLCYENRLSLFDMKYTRYGTNIEAQYYYLPFNFGDVETYVEIDTHSNIILYQ